MHRRTAAAVAAVAALGASAVAVAPASAAKNTITLKGGTVFKAGKFVKDNQRFVAPSNKVKSGATVKVVNKTKSHEPHTLTFIEKKFIPTSFNVDEALMGNIFTAHQVDPTNEEAPPGAFTVDDGQELADGVTWEVDSAFSDTSALGDSAFIAPDQNGPSFQVTAAKGSTLYYFCAIHPWMSGKLRVK